MGKRQVCKILKIKIFSWRSCTKKEKFKFKKFRRILKE